MSRPSAALRAEGFFSFKKNASDGKCWVKGCGNRARSDRSICHKHEMRRWRAKQRLTADFCTLRDHAKARKIKFSITLDYWQGLTDGFSFYEKKDGDMLSIDRVDPTKGYEPGNLRVVTLSLNSYKSNRERYLPEHVQEMLNRKRDERRSGKQEYLDLDPQEENPFWDEPEPEPPTGECPF